MSEESPTGNLVQLDIRDNGVALVTLNRPEAMNALSSDLRSELYEVMQAIHANDAVKAVVLTGAGEKAFTAGLDLKELGADGNVGKEATDRDPRVNPVNAIRSCGKPVVGAVNGVAITGGFEVALACDIIIASSTARFADTHALVGIMPGWGLSQKLSRIVGLARAKEMSFTGRFINAQTACEWGIVSRVVEPENLVDEALALADDIAFVDPGFLRAYGELIESGYSMGFSDALGHEHQVSSVANAGVTAGDIEKRREAVMARGRARK
ncbi:MAG: enoyl-CoA hydratase [Halieaceae bacterium]|nr:enoyl-CoA hydratase [Halieaceae bacterium]